MTGPKHLTSNSEAETKDIAVSFAKGLKGNESILLKGNLGAGKSVFARALIQSLCGKETIVPSPTYTLVQHYQAPQFTLYHYDLYRLSGDPDEIIELGFEEHLYHGVCLIEWPERLGILTPKSAINITITLDDNEKSLRHITIA